MAILIEHKLEHARGTRVSGIADGRMYFVAHDTGLLHPFANNAVQGDADVHPDDAAEFSQFPNLFQRRGAVRPVAPPPPSAPAAAPAAVTAPEASAEAATAAPEGSSGAPAADSGKKPARGKKPSA